MHYCKPSFVSSFTVPQMLLFHLYPTWEVRGQGGLIPLYCGQTKAQSLQGT